MAKSELAQLLYCSRPTSKFNISDINDILAKCSKNNTARDVTGFLVFDGETFLQLLEGPPESLNEIFAKIRADQRHEDIRVLVHEATGSRHFGAWFMAYENVVGENVNFGGTVTKNLCRSLANELCKRPGMGPQTIGKFLKKIVF